jgi:arabinose-5-phosphate isomerase
MNDYIQTAKLILKQEIQGLLDMESIIDDNFVSLVEKIRNIKGKVIISGMGKSGHIAKKISATFASTGTESFFVHPAEASHGDLGMIGSNDLILLLSNSGETAELKDIIYYAKRYNIPLACMVRKAESSLANSSDYPIILPNSDEALSFAAPTTSTTMMLVLGDMIALSLAKSKNFTRDDFQVFHPGGRLGASFVKVQDIMRDLSNTPLVKSDDSMVEAINIMNDCKLGCVIAINSNNEIIGIITDGVIRKNLHLNILKSNVSDLMTAKPKVIQQSSLVVEAINIMNVNGITNLPVIDINKKIVGIIHMHDCLSSGANPKI